MNKWWQDRVIYQIYPRSFCDSNGDGIGDIPGIISKLDYLKELGVGAIWLSPVYTSPNYDFGYDVADYTAINPEYGTMADMKRLLKEAGRRDLKVIMDLVMNHTSDQHGWFQAARDPKSGYRDYYIWRKPKLSKSGKEKPPNNWTSFFTGSAWTRDDRSGEYYLHLFTKHQPDLNFHNPKVIEEIKKVMRFWLDLGVAGFRCDVINLIYKQSLANGKHQLIATGSEHYTSTTGCHAVLQQFNQEVWQPYDAFIIGEIQNGTINSVRDFVEHNELTVGLAFEHMILKLGYAPQKTKRALVKWQRGLDWNPVFFENHDGMRSVSRFGNDKKFHQQSATMLASLLLTLRGTPFIYQGQEIGMTNAPFANITQVKDIVSRSAYKLLRKFFIPSPIAFKLVMYLCRDHARTPMQWNNQAKAGFTTGEPWLMVNPNYQKINVEHEKAEGTSIWNFYHRLIKLRSQTPAWRQGKIKFLSTPKNILAFERIGESGQYRIVVNLDSNKRKAGINLAGQVVSSNYSQSNYDHLRHLRPYEAIIFKINS